MKAATTGATTWAGTVTATASGRCALRGQRHGGPPDLEAPSIKLLLASPGAGAAPGGQQFPVLRVPSVVDPKPACNQPTNNGANGVASISPASDRSAGRRIALRGVSKHFGALRAVDGVGPGHPAWRDFRPHRPQRRGQEHAVQDDAGPHPATQAAIVIGGVRKWVGATFAQPAASSATCPRTWCCTTTSAAWRPALLRAPQGRAAVWQCQPMLETRGPGHADSARCANTQGHAPAPGLCPGPAWNQPRVLFLDEPPTASIPRPSATSRHAARPAAAGRHHHHHLAHPGRTAGACRRLAIMAAGRFRPWAVCRRCANRPSLPLCVTIDGPRRDAHCAPAACCNRPPALPRHALPPAGACNARAA